MSDFRVSRKLRRVLRLVISVVVFLGIALYVHKHSKELVGLLQMDWGYGFTLIGTALILNMSTAARFNVLYLALGARTRLLESFGLSVVASSLNAFLPAQAGGVVRAAYLKSQHHIPYSQAPALFLAGLMLATLFSSVVVLVSGVLLTLTGDQGALFLFLGGGLTCLSGLPFLVNVPEWLIPKMGRLGSMAQLFYDGWKAIRSNRRRLFEACLYQILTTATRALGITVAYKSLGLDISPWAGISVFFLSSLLSMVNITPGNVGIAEGAAGTLSHMSGLTFVQGAAAFALWRVANLVVQFLVAPVAWYLLFFRNDIRIMCRD